MQFTIDAGISLGLYIGWEVFCFNRAQHHIDTMRDITDELCDFSKPVPKDHTQRFDNEVKACNKWMRRSTYGNVFGIMTVAFSAVSIVAVLTGGK